jgi:hypothetical protein
MGGEPADSLLRDHIAEDELRATADELTASGLQVDWMIGTPPVGSIHHRHGGGGGTRM